MANVDDGPDPLYALKVKFHLGAYQEVRATLQGRGSSSPWTALALDSTPHADQPDPGRLRGPPVHAPRPPSPPPVPLPPPPAREAGGRGSELTEGGVVPGAANARRRSARRTTCGGGRRS